MSGQTSDSDSNSSIWGLRGLDDLSSSSSDGRAGSPINETAPVEVAPPTGTCRQDLLRQLEGLQQAMYHNQEMQKALRLAEQSCSCTGSSQYAPAYSEAQVLLNEIPVGVQPVQQQQLEKVQMLPMQFNHGGWVPSAIASQEVAEAPKKKAILQPQTPDKPFYNEYGVDLMKLTDVELEKVVPLNSNGERTSIGALQHPDQCTPCIFWFRNICEKGLRCEFCHLVHPGQIAKKIRPSKSVRMKQKELEKNLDDS